jgi:Secretion system C-terminal sorting domain
LKKFLLIVSLALATTIHTEAQEKSGANSGVSTQASVLRFYPNPATTAITFDFQKSFDKGYSIQIYSMIGRKMLEQTNISDHTTINLAEFTRGMYIYKLFNKSGELVETGKFQVSK